MIQVDLTEQTKMYLFPIFRSTQLQLLRNIYTEN